MGLAAEECLSSLSLSLSVYVSYSSSPPSPSSQDHHSSTLSKHIARTWRSAPGQLDGTTVQGRAELWRSL